MYKPASWHYNHMLDPRSVSAQSIMPSYPWLISNQLDISKTAKKIRVMQTLGVPYPEGYDEMANEDLMKQAREIADELKQANIDVEADREIIALIAYLHRLGVDINKSEQ
jgi:cytochrome c oxidase cbb3-type subunit I/II